MWFVMGVFCGFVCGFMAAALCRISKENSG